LGQIAEGKGNLQAALSHYEEATRRNPMDMEAHLKASEILSAQGKREDAIRHLRRAADLAPTRGKTFLDLGSLLLEERRWRAAAEAFERALHLDADAARCHLVLSQIYQHLALEASAAHQRDLKRATPPIQTGDKPRQ
jgi:tetratricopeptide (TPR) repeat protein